MTTDIQTPRGGETALHKQAKAEIAATMQRGRCAADVVVERPLDGVRPDVSCKIRRLSVAVEVQCSAISAPEIRRRTEIYTALGYYVIWVVPVGALLTPKPYDKWRLTPWQVQLMGMYGCLYVWLLGQTVLAIGADQDRTHLITHLQPVRSAVFEYHWDMPKYAKYPHLLSVYRGLTTLLETRVCGNNAPVESERLGLPAPVNLWTLPPST